MESRSPDQAQSPLFEVSQIGDNSKVEYYHHDDDIEFGEVDGAYSDYQDQVIFSNLCYQNLIFSSYRIRNLI